MDYSSNSSEASTAQALQRDPRELWDLFEAAEDLPTLPEVAIRLQRVIDDADSTAKQVAQIIEDDPAIATKVLKVVNSAFYAPASGSRIKQLSPAVTRLGFVTVANIVLSTSVFSAFSRALSPVFDRREFWKHSICTGIIAGVLRKHLGDKIGRALTRDAVHLAGIVHDMGKILFERYANAEFHQAIASAKTEDIPVIKEECRFIGVGHDEVGAWLGQKWHLPADIAAVVRWHHDPLACPEPDHLPLVKLVHMADYFCHQQQLGDSGNASPQYDHRVRGELELTDETIASLMPTVQAEAANSEILLSVT